jgi:hypothetical protein
MGKDKSIRVSLEVPYRSQMCPTIDRKSISTYLSIGLGTLDIVGAP